MSTEYFAPLVKAVPIPSIPIVYVIRDEKRIKIGKTSRWQSRWKEYAQCNTDIKFVTAWQVGFGSERLTLDEACQVIGDMKRLSRRPRSGDEWFPATPALMEWALKKAELHGKWWEDPKWAVEEAAKLEEAMNKFHGDRFAGLWKGAQR